MLHSSKTKFACHTLVRNRRSVSYQRQQGFLSAIPGYANDIDYQLGGMLHRVVHANNVTWTQTFDPANHWQRPFEISTTNVANANNWSSGQYFYL
jgi:hypothetical protein